MSKKSRKIIRIQVSRSKRLPFTSFKTRELLLLWICSKGESFFLGHPVHIHMLRIYRRVSNLDKKKANSRTQIVLRNSCIIGNCIHHPSHLYRFFRNGNI